MKAVENALEVLEQFKGKRAELGISEISRALGLQKNNVFRLLATLEAKGYVEQNPNNESYRLGIRALELGKAFLSHTGLIRVAQERIRLLSSQVEETVYLGIMKDARVYYVEDAESSQPLRVASRIGTRLSPLCTAMGKVMLAFYEENERERIIGLNHFVRHLPNTIMDPQEFRHHLTEIREQGWALDNEEMDPGVICVAAPVRDYEERIVAAVSISGPATRIVKPAIEEKLLPRLKECCFEISRAIGFSGGL